MSRYRFALRPKWILSHVFVLLLIAVMITAGFWQLGRLHEKQDRNARIVARTAMPVEPVEAILSGPNAKTAGIEFRPARATGVYENEQILIRSRTSDGMPGSWVVAILRLKDGTALAVNRGFIHNSGALTAVPAQFAVPQGTVSVGGLLRDSQTRGRIGAKDPDSGHLKNMARLDVGRIAQQIKGPVLPMYLSLESQDPPVAATDPVPLAREVLDEGPHFGYAVQWFIFTAVAVLGYPLILRRRAGEVEKEQRLAHLDAQDAEESD